MLRLEGESTRKVILVERINEPLGWALPGGFVDVGETVEQAAMREALEETGLDVRLDRLLGVYSDPARDSRGHVVSVVFIATARGRPAAGDDAADARLFAVDDLPSPMAFDHARIVKDYARLVDAEE
jgi:8-oxo-dGTP diphosphatase